MTVNIIVHTSYMWSSHCRSRRTYSLL